MTFYGQLETTNIIYYVPQTGKRGCPTDWEKIIMSHRLGKEYYVPQTGKRLLCPTNWEKIAKWGGGGGERDRTDREREVGV